MSCYGVALGFFCLKVIPSVLWCYFQLGILGMFGGSAGGPCGTEDCSTFVSIFGPLPAQEDGFTAGPRRKASSAGWCQEWLKCFWNLKHRGLELGLESFFGISATVLQLRAFEMCCQLKVGSS